MNGRVRVVDVNGAASPWSTIATRPSASSRTTRRRPRRGEAPLRAFKYWDKGSLATIGRAAAGGDVFGVKLRGFLAWMAWLLIHLFFLIGFRNRFLVILQWAWAYLTFQRGARLITGEEPPNLRR